MSSWANRKNHVYRVTIFIRARTDSFLLHYRHTDVPLTDRRMTTNPLVAFKLIAPQSKTAGLLPTRERLASLVLALRYSAVKQTRRENPRPLPLQLFNMHEDYFNPQVGKKKWCRCNNTTIFRISHKKKFYYKRKNKSAQTKKMLFYWSTTTTWYIQLILKTLKYVIIREMNRHFARRERFRQSKSHC